jgi:hypothetical protein
MGGTCQDANIGYFMAFGSIFITLCLVALIQLVITLYDIVDNNVYMIDWLKSQF